MPGNKRAQDVGDSIFMLSHNDLYYSSFTREQLTQSGAVNIQKAAEQPGRMCLKDLFDMAIETLRAVIGK
jgi:hypothetical protein